VLVGMFVGELRSVIQTVKGSTLCVSVLVVRCLVLSCSGSVGRASIKALLGHESIATTQIYTNVGQERMERVVARL